MRDFYWRPTAAAGRVLDRGGLVAALILVALVSLVSVTIARPGSDGAAEPVGLRISGPVMTVAGMAVFFVPAVVALLALWLHLGSFSVAIRRDYAPLLACVAFAFTAARLPALPLIWLMAGNPKAVDGILAGSLLYWFLLSVFCIRVVLGASWVQAVCGVIVGIAGCAAGSFLYPLLGMGMFLFASPWALYFLYSIYRGMSADASMIGSGLRSQQSFRQALETATLNPRDADAHFQLGLIYQARRQYEQATQRYRTAIEIDRKEPGPHYQLGLIALEQQRYKDALDCFCNVAEADDKYASNEVWRGIGVSCFQLGDHENAIGALRRYTERREYDPEGLYWLGRSLAATGKKQEAAGCYRRAIEAAQTAPGHRRHVVRAWASKSRSELRSLGDEQS